ncbi:MAG: hypothetical protein ABEI57_06160 [Halapricum sp.]
MWVLASLSHVVSSQWVALPTVLQGDVTGGGIAALVVTFLVAWLFYAVTLHLAATFFVGDVASQRAAYAGAVPAVVSILLGQYGLERIAFVSQGLGVIVVVVLTLLADAMAISRVYDLPIKPTAVLTLLHFAFATVLGIALSNLFGLF